MDSKFTGFYDYKGNEIRCGDVVRLEFADVVVFELNGNHHPIFGVPTQTNKHFINEYKESLENIDMLEQIAINYCPTSNGEKIKKEPKTLLSAEILFNLNDCDDSKKNSFVYKYYEVTKKYIEKVKRGDDPVEAYESRIMRLKEISA